MENPPPTLLEVEALFFDTLQVCKLTAPAAAVRVLAALTWHELGGSEGEPLPPVRRRVRGRRRKEVVTPIADP